MTLLTLILYSMNMTSVIFKGADGGALFHPYCPPHIPTSQGSPFHQLAARQTSCKCNLYIYVSISLSSRLPAWAHWCFRLINLTPVVKTLKWALHHCGACLLDALQPSVQNKAQMCFKVDTMRASGVPKRSAKAQNQPRKTKPSAVGALKLVLTFWTR